MASPTCRRPWSDCLYSRDGHGSEVPESTRAGFCVFLSDPNPESIICEKTDPQSLFNFGSSRSLHGHFLSKNIGKFRLDRRIAGVRTGVGFSNLNNCRTRIQNSGRVESESEKVTPAAFVIFLILWTLQPHVTLLMSARTLQCLFEGVWRLQCFRTLPGLDQGWTQCPYALDVELYQVLRVSE